MADSKKSDQLGYLNYVNLPEYNAKSFAKITQNSLYFDNAIKNV